jgi:hypothetical protein
MYGRARLDLLLQAHSRPAMTNPVSRDHGTLCQRQFSRDVDTSRPASSHTDTSLNFVSDS